MLLPDTHTILWLVEQPERLPTRILSIFERGETTNYLSSVIPWEIAIKMRLDKIKTRKSLADIMAICLKEYKLTPLPIKFEHTYQIQSLPLLHKDPFDRMLVAQAKGENLKIVTKDTNIEQYPVKTLWS